MHWSHRVIEFSKNGETVFEFKEVYFVDGKLSGYCDANMSFSDRSEAFILLHRLEDALDKPFLKADDLKIKEVGSTFTD